MKWKYLKPIRVAISLLIFAFVACIFADIALITTKGLIKTLLYLQFIPSLIGFLSSFSLAAAGFLFIMLLTLLFGRIYCSSLCPLGTIQDIVNGIRSRWNPGNILSQSKIHYRKPVQWVSYPILALTLLLLLAGNLFLLTLLDPFSLAGRSLSGLIGLFIDLPGNPLFFSLDSLRSPEGETAMRTSTSWCSWVVTLTMFLAIVLLAVWKGRWYCTVICPVGTLLGILSRISLFRLKLDTVTCSACGSCMKVCKTGCIDNDAKILDFDRCVACFNCLEACSNGAIGFKVQGSRFKGRGSRVKGQESGIEVRGSKFEGRRAFLKNAVLSVSVAVPSLAIAPALFSRLYGNPAEELAGGEKNSTDEENPYPATPPGSVSVAYYTERCTSCHLCVSVCPTGVLQPTIGAFGLAGILQPAMDFEAGLCRYECTKCLDICPTGAILSLSPEQKKRIRIGIARFIKNLCIPVAERTSCSLCSELCPTRAITMKPYLGELTIPVIDEKTCTGCGACEYICPTRPVRAMYVEPLKVHTIAGKAKTC